jgi:hypothetical protein
LIISARQLKKRLIKVGISHQFNNCEAIFQKTHKNHKKCHLGNLPWPGRRDRPAGDISTPHRLPPGPGE